MTLSVSVRYCSPLVAIHDVDCSARVAHCSDEEATSADEIAIVRRGMFLKRGPRGEHLLDPTRVALFTENEPYVVDHPGEHGDYSTVLTFGTDLLQEAMSGLAPESSSPFSGLPSAIPVDRELMLTFHGLLAALGCTPADDFLIAERAMRVLDRVGSVAATTAGSQRPTTTRPLTADPARALLAERWSSRITLNELAAELGVSPFQLCRRFRAATGTTVHRYLTTLRMAAALDRIGDYRGDLARLALDLGYSSHSHFTTAFQAYFGLPPSALATSCKNPEAPETPIQ